MAALDFLKSEKRILFSGYAFVLHNKHLMGLISLGALTCACVTTNAQESRKTSIETKLSHVRKLSWYNCNRTPRDCSRARRTSSGTAFDHRRMTAASSALPNGTELLIKAFGRQIKVCVNDRGASSDRLDLTSGAFKVLAPLKTGVIRDGQFQIHGIGTTDPSCKTY